MIRVFLPDTLRAGEFSVGLHSSKFHREPGDLDIGLFPLSLTLGLHERLEIFFSWEAYKRVNADAILVNKVGPDGPIVPARLPTPARTLTFYDDTPFMDVGFGDGTGDLWAGLKVNLLSERRGSPLGFAIQPIARFSTKNNREHLLRGLTSGATDAGFDLILSRNLRGGNTVGGHAGFLFSGDSMGIDRQSRFNYGLGVTLPMTRRSARLTTEIVGSTFYGSRTGQANPTSPLDLHGGLRFFPTPWLTIGGAYTFNVRTLEPERYGVPATDRHGWSLQVVFQRKINEPPTADCRAERKTVTEGDFVLIHPTVRDPDDDILSVTWKSSAGRMIQQGSSVIFDSTGLNSGKYIIRAEFTDGDHTVTCSVEVTVTKRTMPVGNQTLFSRGDSDA